MHARATLLGHPIHQMLIVFPLGLLSTSLAFDIAHFATGNPRWGEIAYWMITAGIIGGLLAAVFGLIDFLAIPRATRARAIGLLHGVGNVIVVGLFIASWIIRRPDPGVPHTAALVLSIMGIALALVTGWLGGELVARLGVGVDEGANVNAPSSLSGLPATGATRTPRL